MPKVPPAKTSGNVFKSIVRSVVKEELVHVEKKLDKKFERLEQRLDVKFEAQNETLKRRFELLTENLLEHMNHLFTKYRDETLTKLDKAIGTIQKTYQEQEIHAGQHVTINDHLDKLESIHPHGRHG